MRSDFIKSLDGVGRYQGSRVMAPASLRGSLNPTPPTVVRMTVLRQRPSREQVSRTDRPHPRLLPKATENRRLVAPAARSLVTTRQTR